MYFHGSLFVQFSRTLKFKTLLNTLTFFVDYYKRVSLQLTTDSPTCTHTKPSTLNMITCHKEEHITHTTHITLLFRNFQMLVTTKYFPNDIISLGRHYIILKLMYRNDQSCKLLYPYNTIKLALILL